MWTSLLLAQFLLLLVNPVVSQLGPNFATTGPCAVTTDNTKRLTVPEALRISLPHSLPSTLSIPACPASSSLPFGPRPHPVLVFYNGFEVGILPLYPPPAAPPPPPPPPAMRHPCFPLLDAEPCELVLHACSPGR